MNFYEFVTGLRVSFDYYDHEDFSYDDEDYIDCALDLSDLDDDDMERYLDILTDECDIPEEAIWEMEEYDGDWERGDLITIDDAQAGMEIVKKYAAAFAKAAYLFENEGEGAEALYGVGGYFWWGDDELEEEFQVEKIDIVSAEEE